MIFIEQMAIAGYTEQQQRQLEILQNTSLAQLIEDIPQNNYFGNLRKALLDLSKNARTQLASIKLSDLKLNRHPQHSHVLEVKLQQQGPSLIFNTRQKTVSLNGIPVSYGDFQLSQASDMANRMQKAWLPSRTPSSDGDLLIAFLPVIVIVAILIIAEPVPVLIAAGVVSVLGYIGSQFK